MQAALLFKLLWMECFAQVTITTGNTEVPISLDSDTEWSYAFDWQTIDRRAIARIGLASNDYYGNTTVLRLDMETGRPEVRHRNTV